jgi:hypothetical protein
LIFFLFFPFRRGVHYGEKLDDMSSDVLAAAAGDPSSKWEECAPKSVPTLRIFALRRDFGRGRRIRTSGTWSDG